MNTSLNRITTGVHASLSHESANGHVTGSAIYIDDMPLPSGALHAAVLLSPYAHARIKSIDVTKAEKAPGVIAIVTAQDIPGHNDIGPIGKDEPILAPGLVEYAGQIVAAIAARTLDQARAAVNLIEVDYEVLPAVLDLAEAVEKKLLVANEIHIERGAVDDMLASAPHRLNGEARCGGQDHFYLEGQIAIAVPGEGIDMQVYSSTQHPTEVQHGVAHLLGVSYSQITCEVRRMGGAFGGKESQATIIAGIAAVLAHHCRRPVKLRLPRDVDMLATGKRHDFLFRYDVGFDGEGRILALDLLLAANGGSVMDLTPPVLSRALCHADNCYYLPVVRLHGMPCKTNTVSNTAFRGFGGPQGMFAIEGVIDEIAHHLGIGVDEVRRRNFYGVGERDVTPYGQTVHDNIIAEVMAELDAAKDLADWRAEIDAFNETSPVIKKGLATMPIKFGISFNKPELNQAGSLIHVYVDGSVHLNHGGTEMGQGLYTKVAQVVAETFQIDLDMVRVTATSTGKVPNTSPTAASSGSDLNGMAALNAATIIKERMTKVAAKHFDVPAKDIVFADNRIHAGNRSISFKELAEMSWQKREQLSAAGYYKTPGIAWDFRTNSGTPFYYYAYGAAASEVAIDTLTGETRVLRTEIVHDAGKSLNPAIDLGQIEGAFVQGMGWLTCEELVWDKEGRLKTHGPSTYKIPGSRDVPKEFNVRLLDQPNRKPTIFRSKAIGEPPFMLAISVWLAIRDAVSSLSGHRLATRLDAPATNEKVLAAVEDMKARLAGAA